ncbi:MAG: hypothetical protein ACFHX7_22065 [Pseudomonadota bacterium]
MTVIANLFLAALLFASGVYYGASDPDRWVDLVRAPVVPIVAACSSVAETRRSIAEGPVTDPEPTLPPPKALDQRVQHGAAGLDLVARAREQIERYASSK